ncbi:MAG: IS91 family transposase, partial [Cytophagales bacterium]|nr:IS91 family transposase [Cytophagales bacterium]
RTAVLGGHIEQCNECGRQRNTYNSCRNRHCPKCQGLDQLKWLEKRKQELLPINYFHLVFTIPSELNYLVWINQKVLYTILFKAASQTITMLARQDKHLGANPGCIAMLHTWGQNLMDHPHIHMIVTGGGLAPDGKKWIHSSKKFFIPVRIIARVFRGKYLAFFKQAYYNNEIFFQAKTAHLKNHKQFKQTLDSVYKKQWVVYAKKPFSNPAKVLTYLGKYTHRIAISNHRILSMENNRICFKWKDYQDNNKQKVMNLNPNEFIRRFLLHILPTGFFKIRYYGLLASRNKKHNLIICCKLLNVVYKLNKLDAQTWQKLLLKSTGFDVNKCPYCKKGQMKIIGLIPARGHPF